LKRRAAGDEIFDYVNECFCSDYENSLEVFHDDCEVCATTEEMFEGVETQKLGDCQNEKQRMESGGKVLN
jgi:hypothetical protein